MHGHLTIVKMSEWTVLSQRKDQIRAFATRKTFLLDKCLRENKLKV